MPITRLIYVKVEPDQSSEAEIVWTEKCAPLMIQQPGCVSEQMLKCIDSPGEYISYSEWDNQESIEQYLASEDHQEIKKHSRELKRVEDPVVKRYEVVS